jgi:superfamily I DNA and/or RNA helicase
VAFDVVVFDEASQVEPADALGAVARGSQVVLFGDERQLPPTSFFARIEGGDEGLLDEDDAAAGRLESVLSLAIARLPAKNRAPLSWHYRSRDPSLVEFSNRRFYDGALVTFPGPRARREDVGVFFRPVEPGTYRRGAGQSNPAEARAVAQAVVAHAAAWVRAGGGPSLGVGAMSVAQQQAIEDEVDRLRRADATRATEPVFATDLEEPFFV